MNKILPLLNRIPKDKWQHLNIGSVIAAVAFIAGLVAVGFWTGFAASVAVVVAAAYCKEVWDGKNGGVFDRMDIVATLIGGAVIWLPLLVLHLCF